MQTVLLTLLVTLLSSPLANSFAFVLPSPSRPLPTSLSSPVRSIKLFSEPPTEDPAPDAPEDGAADDGALYDKDVPIAKDSMSSGMREKLLKEAQGLGADPNKKSVNLTAILLLAAGILVVVGGKGTLF